MARVTFNRRVLAEVCRRNDVSRLFVFGSAARGEATETSDVDLIVEFSRRKSLLGLLRVERELSGALGRKADVMTEAALSPYLRERILREARVIYEAR